MNFKFKARYKKRKVDIEIVSSIRNYDRYIISNKICEFILSSFEFTKNNDLRNARNEIEVAVDFCLENGYSKEKFTNCFIKCIDYYIEKQLVNNEEFDKIIENRLSKFNEEFHWGDRPHISNESIVDYITGMIIRGYSPIKTLTKKDFSLKFKKECNGDRMLSLIFKHNYLQLFNLTKKINNNKIKIIFRNDLEQYIKYLVNKKDKKENIINNYASEIYNIFECFK